MITIRSHKVTELMKVRSDKITNPATVICCFFRPNNQNKNN
jgi:hypothetical protein